jgi:flagellar biosynthesis/type III secretory pathway protein FliH
MKTINQEHLNDKAREVMNSHEVPERSYQEGYYDGYQDGYLKMEQEYKILAMEYQQLKSSLR